MKISYLIEREPFDKIFEETFSSFLDDHNKRSHYVKWYPKNHTYKNTDSIQRWYCNPLINSIFVKNVNPAVFSSISGEYAHNPYKPWWSLIQRAYLFLSQFNLTSSFLSKYVILVSPPIEEARNKLIIGGNTKIRMIDIAHRKVYVILKKGFDKKYVQRELYVRSNFTYIPIPKIHTHGSNGLWYSEEYISGISPDRMRGDCGQGILMEAIHHIHKMLNETKKTVSLLDYMGLLQKKIIEGIDQNSQIDTSFKKKIAALASTFVLLLKRYDGHVVTRAYCHGDFQQGNIISNGEKSWILDWEYSGQKQIGYDLFVLLLKSRVSGGFSNRFLLWLNNEIDHDQMELINNWPEIKWNTKHFREIYLFLFLLEELVFHLEENNNDLFYGESKGLTAYYKELIKICIGLKQLNWISK